MEKVLQQMATNVSPLLNIWAPKAFENMVRDYIRCLWLEVFQC